MSLVGRELVPPCGLGIVLWDAFTLVVHHPKVELRLGVSLVGRKAKPLCGLGIVLWDAFTLVVHHPKVELRLGVSLVGREAVPPCGLGGVLGDTLAGVIGDPQAELGLSAALLGKDAGQRIGRCFACAEAEQEPADDGRSKGQADHRWDVMPRSDGRQREVACYLTKTSGRRRRRGGVSQRVFHPKGTRTFVEAGNQGKSAGCGAGFSPLAGESGFSRYEVGTALSWLSFGARNTWEGRMAPLLSITRPRPWIPSSQLSPQPPLDRERGCAWRGIEPCGRIYFER